MEENNSISLLGKVAGANLVLMLLYTIIGITSQTGLGGGLIVSAVIAIYHAIALFIVSMITFAFKKNEWAKSLLLSALILVIVGFSVCTGTLVIIEH